MNLADMRKALKNVYSSTGWKSKVEAMKPEQVEAIYFRLQREGVIKGAVR